MSNIGDVKTVSRMQGEKKGKDARLGGDVFLFTTKATQMMDNHFRGEESHACEQW